MSIFTYSGFTYGHTIDSENQYINFEDGTGELSATVEFGSYTLQQFTEKVAQAMNSATLTQEYFVTVDRETRLITVSSAGNFDLLVTAGQEAAISAFGLMGFTTDRSGANSYVADVPSGFFYEPQFLLQGFVDFKHNVSAANSKVNQSASGIVEAISFGKVEIMEADIVLCTNIEQSAGGPVKNNPTGVEEVEAFLNYATSKAPMEFIYDVENPDIYESCILEKTRQNAQGTAFKLQEQYARKLVGYFNTGLLSFRKVSV